MTGILSAKDTPSVQAKIKKKKVKKCVTENSEYATGVKSGKTCKGKRGKNQKAEKKGTISFKF